MSVTPAEVAAFVFAVRLQASQQDVPPLEVLETLRAETIRDIAGDRWSEDGALDLLDLLDRVEEALR